MISETMSSTLLQAHMNSVIVVAVLWAIPAIVITATRFTFKDRNK